MELSAFLEFINDGFVHLILVLLNPIGKYLGDDLPMIVVILDHTKQDSVATIINGIYGKHLLFKTSQFSEVKLTKTATGFDQPGEMYDFGKIYLHRFSIRVPRQ